MKTFTVVQVKRLYDKADIAQPDVNLMTYEKTLHFEVIKWQKTYTLRVID